MAQVGEVVTLVIDGRALQGWQNVRVTRSAEAAAIAFDLQATNPAWSSEARAVQKGKQVEIYTSPGGEIGSFGGGDLLCRGYVDDYEVEIGESANREVGLSGRSKAGDAIDCAPVKHKTGEVKDKKLDEVANEFDEWDIGFRSDVDTEALKKVQLVPGESMFRVLEREARHLGVLLTGQPDGSVKITKAGSSRQSGGLVEGQPPLRGIKLRFSMQNRFSEIVARGQASDGTDEKAIRQEEKVTEQSIERYRPYLLFNEGSHTSKELKRRAEWEGLRRSGSGVSCTAKVSTWRDDGGKLWEPGKLVAVKIPSEDLDTDLAISTVSFQQSVGEGEGSGTIAELTLVDPKTLGGKESSGGSGGLE